MSLLLLFLNRKKIGFGLSNNSCLSINILSCSSLAFLRYRSRVLSRWLAGLPLQLSHLGSRNPELSTQLIDIIHTAATQANKDLLKSLQAAALRIYGEWVFCGGGQPWSIPTRNDQREFFSWPFFFLVYVRLNCSNRMLNSKFILCILE